MTFTLVFAIILALLIQYFVYNKRLGSIVELNRKLSIDVRALSTKLIETEWRLSDVDRLRGKPECPFNLDRNNKISKMFKKQKPKTTKK